MADATVSFPDLLAIADGQRTAGRLREADELCGQLLDFRPGHPDVLHLRALIAHDGGDESAAIDFMGQAVAANEKEAHLHWNLAEMCRRAGRLDEALEASRRALTLEPRSPGRSMRSVPRFAHAESIERRWFTFSAPLRLRLNMRPRI
jgi:tetratricopeptide (TPR) repeat protein